MENKISIPYDLAQNFLFGEELKSLQHLCVSSIVSFIFKSEEVIKEIVSLDLRKILEFEAVEDLDVTIKKVEEKALEQISLKHLHNLVREIVLFTASEIYTFLFKNKFFDRRLFLKNFVYTTQGTINTYKTVLEILKIGDLNNNLKFKIACFYFIEESVINYLNKLPESSREDLLLCESEDMATYVPISYWYNHLNFLGEERLKNVIKEYYVRETQIANRYKRKPFFTAFLLWAVCFANDTAVSYLCLNSVEKKKYLKDLFLGNCFRPHHQGLSNIYMYLYFDSKIGVMVLYPNQRNDFLQVILSHRWVCLLLKISKAFLESYGHFDTLCILSIIIGNLCRSIRKNIFSGKYRETLQKFINIIPPKEKDFIRNQFKYIDLVESLLYSKDKECIQIILGIGIPNRFLEDHTNFYPMLKELEFSLIDVCMEGISSNDAINFKRKIFLNNAKRFCEEFIFEDVSFLNSFLKWGSSFCSVQEMINLKASIPYYEGGGIINKLIFPSWMERNGHKFKFADNVLHWCFENKDFVSIYKKRAVLERNRLKVCKQLDNFQYETKRISKYVSFYSDIKRSIFNREWKFLNKLFLWASCSPEEVRSFKNEFKNDPKFLNQICQKNDIKLLRSFAEWCRDEDEDESNQFSRMLFRIYRKHINDQTDTIECNDYGYPPGSPPD
ncbi:UNVERIFIED_CONTAM: hypothetical protein RMT77_011342 [Armadillidium vulgare]